MISQAEARRNKREVKRLRNLLKGWSRSEGLPEGALYWTSLELEPTVRSFDSGVQAVKRHTIVGIRSGTTLDVYLVPVE